MTPLHEETKAILSNFWHYQNDQGRDRGITFDEAEKQLLQAFQSAMERVIGSVPTPHDNDTREQLRQEQRTRMNKELGGTE